MTMKKILPVILILMSFAVATAGDIKPVKPAAKDKCPVCGMFVAKYPDFLAQVIFRDGTYAVFDGTKDMFKYLLNMKTYNPGKKPSDIAAVFVTDYYLVTYVDGRKAYYVLGSDVFGPMGKELIPFAKEADAKAFVKDHKGKSVLKFSEVNSAILAGLD